MRAETDAYAIKTLTEAEQQNAEVVAQAIAIEGQIESMVMKGGKKKRKHQQIMGRLEAMAGLSQNQ